MAVDRSEQLLDAICQATGVPEKFNGWPEGVRAIQLWDNRMPSYFFRIFGRPVRATVCECERSGEPSIAQALHLMNGDAVNDRIRRGKVVERLIAEGRKDREIMDELFLRVFGRAPRAAEVAAVTQALAADPANRQAVHEDLFWALMNSKEFYFNH